MKKPKLIIGTAILFFLGSILLNACGSDYQTTEKAHEHTDKDEHKHTLNTEHQENTATFEGEKTKDLSLILESYFQVKNALVKDDAKTAATASEQLLTALNGFDMPIVAADKMKVYMEIMDDANENAEHISENADKIDHQREHLVNLSEDVNDLIALIGTDKKLYQDFCPMANDGKGAIWISEIKEIQNPYMGTKMPKCGKVQKEW